eukprot:9220792-Pyramimonas_sp.AAC.1
MVPASVPNACFDDVEPRATGSQQHATTTMINATTAYSRCLAEQGLDMADKSAVISASMGMANDICK